jgi:hypothetical protein
MNKYNDLSNDCKGCYVFGRIMRHRENGVATSCVIMNRIRHPHIKSVTECPCWNCLVKVACSDRINCIKMTSITKHCLIVYKNKEKNEK